MKTQHIKWIFIMAGISHILPLISQSSNHSYIMKRTYTTETFFLDEIHYLDGFGRPVQNVQKGITPQGNDLVSLRDYDFTGRESQAWLPVNTTTTTAGFRDIQSIKTRTNTVYGSDSIYYRTVYENSPMNRITEQYGPGKEWYRNRKSVKTTYTTNSTVTEYRCRRYSVTGFGMNTVLQTHTDYLAGELFITKLEDEDGNTSYEFKDKDGQIVMIRQKDGTTYLDTYYVYDDFGNLCYVLPPLMTDAIGGQNSGTIADSQTQMKQYAYLYKYDERGRCVAKRLPGCDWIYFKYDEADQLIFSQDGEQRLSGSWTFCIPDELGRTVITGECTYPDIYGKVYARYLDMDDLHGGYDIFGTSFRQDFVKDFTINYYDTYDFLSREHSQNRPELNYQVRTGYNTRYGNDNDKVAAKGLLTGSRIYCQSSLSTSDSYLPRTILTTAYYYDQKGQLIQTHADNILNGRESEFTSYNYTGQPVNILTIHEAPGKTTQTELYSYSYDHAGRGTEIRHKLNSQAEVVLAKNTYDEVGRLLTSMPNNLTRIKQTYSYNVRSWVTDIASGIFTQKLYYNLAHNGGKACYNGNLSGAAWWSGTNYAIGFNYEYDNLSRLTYARSYFDYNPGTPFYGAYDARYTYDKHGNIISMWHIEDLCYIDNLTFTHEGNQLKRATEWDIDEYPFLANGKYNFHNYAAGTHNGYEYNQNGALVKDPYKGAQFTYNELHMPKKVSLPAILGSIDYSYTPAGEKVQALYRWHTSLSLNPLLNTGTPPAQPNAVHKLQYVGNKIYENGNLKRILTGKGYIENGNYFFYMKDHLGNNCRVVNAGGTIVETTYYHAFGIPIGNGESTSVWKQPYKFGDKEFDTMNGLNLYDFHKRQYDASLARFTTMDPLAEKYYSMSPYAYCANNPLNAFDLNGDSIWFTVENDVATMHVTGKLINRSGDNINMGRAAKDIASGIAKSFEGKFTMNGKAATLKTDIQICAVSSMDDVSASDHLFVLAESNGKIARGATSMDGGKIMTIWAGDFASDNWFSNTFSSNHTRTAVHEFGHAVGLNHRTGETGRGNLMTPERRGINITQYQRQIMMKRANTINRGPNSYNGNSYPYIHYLENGKLKKDHINKIGLSYGNK